MSGCQLRCTGRRAGRAADPTAAAIDSQSMKTMESGGPSGYDAGKKINGRKRHITAAADGLPIAVLIHEASIQDRDGAPGVILRTPAAAPQVTKLQSDGGCQGPKPASALVDPGLGSLIEIMRKPEKQKGFTVLHRRWAVERTFAWMSRCRRLAKDYERSLASSLSQVQLARLPVSDAPAGADCRKNK